MDVPTLKILLLVMGADSSKPETSQNQRPIFVVPKTPIQGVEIALPPEYTRRSILSKVFVLWSISFDGASWTAVSQGPFEHKPITFSLLISFSFFQAGTFQLETQ